MAAGSFAQNFQPSWLTYDITVEHWNHGYDEWGKPTYGAPVNMKCYIEEKVQMVRDQAGSERASNTTLYVAGGPIDPHDRITMPDSFYGLKEPPIIGVSNVYDRLEFSHSEVHF